jgi:hypothetical protein
MLSAVNIGVKEKYRVEGEYDREPEKNWLQVLHRPFEILASRREAGDEGGCRGIGHSEDTP